MKITENRYAKEIRVIRAELKISQAELARRLKINQRTVSYYETGKTIPSVAVWDKIMAMRDQD